MKKLLSCILVVTLCFMLSACGSSKFVGTYERETSRKHYIVVPKSAGQWLHNDTITGTATYEINSGGTGRYYFTANKAAYYGENYVIIDADIEWEVVDDYLYVTGTAYYKDESNDSFEIDEQFVLEGKTLVDATYDTIRYNKKWVFSKPRGLWLFGHSLLILV